MDEGDHFLKMEPHPVTDFVHPLFLRLQRHEMHATTAPCDDFWQLVSRGTLKDVGFEDVGAAQAEIIGQKITSEAELSSSLVDSTKRWVRLLRPQARVTCVLAPSVASEVETAWQLVVHDCSEFLTETGVLERGLDQAKHANNKILHGFTATVHGCSLLTAVGKKLAEEKAISPYLSVALSVGCCVGRGVQAEGRGRGSGRGHVLTL